MAIDLDRDFTINGHVFKAGKSVNAEVDEPDADGKTHKVDYSSTLSDLQKAAQESDASVNAHHGAVPDPENPQAATAQTPTRPLAAPNLAVDELATGGTEQSNEREVKDPDGSSANSTGKKK